MFLFILPRGRAATSLRVLIIPSSRLKERNKRIVRMHVGGCVRVRVSVNVKTKTKKPKREREREVKHLGPMIECFKICDYVKEFADVCPKINKKKKYYKC